MNAATAKGRLEWSFALWLWWGARCAGSVGAWPGGCHSSTENESGATSIQARRLTMYQKTVLVSEAKMALVPLGYAKLC